jgi:hypothetical protein
MSDLNIDALHHFTAVAMGAGIAAFTEKAQSGEIDLSLPLSEMLGDFPAQFCSIRSHLVSALTDPSDSWRET